MPAAVILPAVRSAWKAGSPLVPPASLSSRQFQGDSAAFSGFLHTSCRILTSMWQTGPNCAARASRFCGLHRRPRQHELCGHGYFPFQVNRSTKTVDGTWLRKILGEKAGVLSGQLRYRYNIA
jgi:hypothetical protein